MATAPAPRTPRKRPPRNSDRPAGRPSAVLAPIHTRDGRTITVADRIVELIAIGAYAERAARSAGVPKATFYGWLERAQMARETLAMKPGTKLSPHDAACLALSDAVEDAESTYEMTALAALERIGQGGVNLTTTVEKYGIGENGEQVLVERQTRVTGLAPNPSVLMWKLVRRFPERYQLRPDAGAAAAAGDELVDLTPGAIADMVSDVEAFANTFDV